MAERRQGRHGLHCTLPAQLKIRSDQQKRRESLTYCMMLSPPVFPFPNAASALVVLSEAFKRKMLRKQQ